MAKYRKTTLTEISEPWETGKCDGDFACVRRYSRPSDDKCKHCGESMADHGWIDTLEGGHIVCPGDRICTGAKDEKYPIKPGVFETTYEKV